MAVARLRLPNSRRGTSGLLVLFSTSVKTARITIPATIEPAPRTEPQPASGPLTRPSTSRDEPAVVRIAPTASKLPRASEPRSSGASVPGAAAAANRASGTRTSRTHSQPQASVRTPPSSAPAARPPLPQAPQTASALLRSGPSAKRVLIRVSVAGVRRAAPKPWTARAVSSTPGDSAKPPRRQDRPKITSPRMNMRRAPRRSTARPPKSRNPPKATA